MTAELKIIRDKGFNQQCIDILKELLQQAESGEIYELVAMTNYGSGHYETRYTDSENLMELVGHIEKIKWRMLERMSRNIKIITK